MSWISDAELSDMRADVANMLFDTAVIKSQTKTSDNAGGWTTAWTPVSGGTVSCRVDPISRQSDMVALNFGKETTVVMYQLTVPYDAPLADDRRVTIGSNTYEIVKLDIDHSKNVSRRAFISEVR